MSKLSKNVRLGEALEIRGDADQRAELERSVQQLTRVRMAEVEEKVRLYKEAADQEIAREIEAGQKEAARIVAEGEAQKEAVREQAYNDGFQSGFEKGLIDAGEKIAPLMAGVDSLLEKAYQTEKQILSGFQNKALTLLNTLGKKILHEELAQKPELLLALIHQAVENLYLTGKVRVVVSTSTLEFLRTLSGATDKQLAGGARLELVGDDLLDLNDVYVVSDQGSFDISPARQLENLTTALKEHLPIETGLSSNDEPIQAGIPELDTSFDPEAGSDTGLE